MHCTQTAAPQPISVRGARRREEKGTRIALVFKQTAVAELFGGRPTSWASGLRERPRASHEIARAVRGCRRGILDKLTAFHREHDTGMAQVLGDLQAAVGQMPAREHATEARPLQEELQKIQEGRQRGPQLLGDILPLVLARLGIGVVPSTESAE